MREASALGLDTLVEAHDADELERATCARRAGDRRQRARPLDVRASTGATQLAAARRRRRATAIVVAESAIATRAQGAAAELAGANAMLVGSTLMRAPDPGAKLAELISRPARQGLRADAAGGRRRRGRGRRRPRRLHPRAGEPAPHRRAARRTRHGAPRRRLRRRDARDRRRPRPVLRARERPSRPRRRAAAATASAVGTVVDLPVGSRRPDAPRARARDRGPRDARGRPRRRRTSREAIDAVRPWAVDSARSTEREPGIKDHERCAPGSEAARMEAP